MLDTHQYYNQFHLVNIIYIQDSMDQFNHKYIIVLLLQSHLLLDRNLMLSNFDMQFKDLVNTVDSHLILCTIYNIDYLQKFDRICILFKVNNYCMLNKHQLYNLFLLVDIHDIMDSMDQQCHKYILAILYLQFILLLIQNLELYNFNKQVIDLVNIINNCQIKYITYKINFQDLFNHKYIELVVSNHSMLNMNQLCNLILQINILCKQDSKDRKYHKCIQLILFPQLLLLQIQNLEVGNFNMLFIDLECIDNNHLIQYIICILD